MSCSPRQLIASRVSRGHRPKVGAGDSAGHPRPPRDQPRELGASRQPCPVAMHKTADYGLPMLPHGAVHALRLAPADR